MIMDGEGEKPEKHECAEIHTDISAGPREMIATSML